MVSAEPLMEPLSPPDEMRYLDQRLLHLSLSREGGALGAARRRAFGLVLLAGVSAILAASVSDREG